MIEDEAEVEEQFEEIVEEAAEEEQDEVEEEAEEEQAEVEEEAVAEQAEEDAEQPIVPQPYNLVCQRRRKSERIAKTKNKKPRVATDGSGTIVPEQYILD